MDWLRGRTSGTGIDRPRPALRLVGAAVVGSAFAAIAAMSTPAAAEEPEEVLIGTFKVRPSHAGTTSSDTEAEAPTPDRSALERTPSRANATDQLGAALALFAAGDRGGGQRALEVLVAQWPGSPEAGHARKALADLYRLAGAALSAPSAAPALPAAAPPRDVAAMAAAAPPATSPAAPVSPAPGAAPAPTATGPAIAEGWAAEVRRDTGLDRRFIMDVGDRVFFGLSSADLGARARTVLSAQARWLGERPTLYAIVEGHADEPGSDADNVVLSQRRADAVRDRLIEEGVGPDRLKAVGVGRNQRLAQCDEAECAAQNRRVVTAIFSRDGTGPAPRLSPLSALPPPATRDAPATAIADLRRAPWPRR